MGTPADKKTEKNDDVFDVARIRQLVELMKENELSEIDLKQGDLRIQLHRADTKNTIIPPGLMFSQASLPTAPTAPQVPASFSAQTANASADNKSSGSVNESQFKTIVSPMVGTFFAAGKPGAPAFVHVGDQVDPDKTVCIIEAMKVFNEIKAEMSGKIVAVLVEDGDPVEYGKPLFKIDPQG